MLMGGLEDVFVRRETRKVQEDLQADLLRTVCQLKTPNILLIGRTGVGAHRDQRGFPSPLTNPQASRAS